MLRKFEHLNSVDPVEGVGGNRPFLRPKVYMFFNKCCVILKNCIKTSKFSLNRPLLRKFPNPPLEFDPLRKKIYLSHIENLLEHYLFESNRNLFLISILYLNQMTHYL